MEIVPVNLEDTKEIKNIIEIIYSVFLSSNIQDSTERLIERMKKLYGPEYDYDYTLLHFKKSTLFFVAKEHDEIIGMVRWNPDKLSNIYICQQRQWKWIGQSLLEAFEHAAKELWSTSIQLKSSKYALPFYIKNGYTVDHDNRLIKYI